MRCVLTPQETSKPTPPAETTPPASGIEGGDAANRKAIAPMRVGHGVGGPHDPRQLRDIGDLLEDLVVHFGNERFCGEDHAGTRISPRAGCAIRTSESFLQTREVHRDMSPKLSGSNIDDALRAPSPRLILLHGKFREGRSFNFHCRRMTLAGYRFSMRPAVEKTVLDLNLEGAENHTSLRHLVN